MASKIDKFIDIIEDRRKKLQGVIEACQLFKERLGQLPPDLAKEAEQMLWSELDAQAPVTDELAGKTALECVAIILKEHDNQPMHFSTVAKEAIRRGYKGRLSGSADEIESTTVKSFWAAMSRSDDLEPAGKGMYRLKPLPQVGPPLSQGVFDLRGSAFDFSGKGGVTQADAAQAALEAANSPRRISWIIDFITGQGWFEKPLGKMALRSFSNAVWAAMSRDPRFVRVGRGLWALKKWENATTPTP